MVCRVAALYEEAGSRQWADRQELSVCPDNVLSTITCGVLAITATYKRSWCVRERRGLGSPGTLFCIALVFSKRALLCVGSADGFVILVSNFVLLSNLF